MVYRRIILAATLLLVCLVPVALPGAAGARALAGASTLNRPEDPVVLTGGEVPTLTGIAPADLVAFRYEGGWQQVPVQVDERAVQSFNTIYNNSGAFYGGFSTLVYTDSGTFTGPDPDPTLDANDEIAFMAKDAGGAPPSFSEPGGVVAGTGVDVTITDPLSPGAVGHVYLFRQSGGLDPGAGKQYVSYSFSLLSGPYKTTYNTADGPNAENSTASSAYYSHHFGDRWLEDQLHVTAGGATGVDILDRHEAMFAPGNCYRTEDTFDNGDAFGFPGEGAFVVNKSGPVRAIRSYVGANSGPRTQREHVFYEQREDVRTFLRVHSIPAVMDLFDYSPAASGMTYYNSLNTGGVPIDGSPDAVTTGPLTWEMASGPQGSLVMAGLVSTDIPGFTYTSYYLDSITPSPAPCTGDAFAYAQSGLWVNLGYAIPCTDPNPAVCTGANYLNATRVMYFQPPGESVSQAQALAARAAAPLVHSAGLWRAPVGGLALPPDLAALRPAASSPSTLRLAGEAALVATLTLALAAACWRILRRSRHRT